ncbi:hypothetical protein [Edwardsiella tarda]|uniref:Phage tail protein n=1 Tax=Edwardsiella tarda TaxID=636 RepID=A0A2A7U7Q2_EDWTA|nr:hypothetical protein [Edwardsiella tarda]PEH74291.1 hypothetical protein CRM76_01215 [Edwardsiella tarda]
MSFTWDIFSGGMVGIAMNESVANKDLGSESYIDIPECAAFPETGVERGTINVPNFSSPYNRKLVGRMSVPDITLNVNYIPGSAHDKLVKAAEDGKRIQIRICYYSDSTKTAGIAIAYNGFISKANMTGGDEAVVAREFTFSVDGAPVGQKVFTPDAPLATYHMNVIPEAVAAKEK